MQEEEIWKDIPGYEGMYQASNLGRVKSLPRIVKHTLGGDKKIKGKILSLIKNHQGYTFVRVSKFGVAKNLLTHRAVAASFLEYDLESELVINHKDFNRANNNVTNLEVCSHRDNIIHYWESVKDKSSPFLGVHKREGRNYYVAHIGYNGRKIQIGSYKSELDAHNAYLKYKESIESGNYFLINSLINSKIEKAKRKGITWYSKRGKWCAKYKTTYIGLYDSVLDARMARQEWLINRGIPIYS